MYTQAVGIAPMSTQNITFKYAAALPDEQSSNYCDHRAERLDKLRKNHYHFYLQHRSNERMDI